MSIRRLIAKTPFLRPLALRMLRLLARDTDIQNPWTGDKLYLNSFRHKGYWFFGKDRERSTMEKFAQIIRPGTTVIEVGGHIGYLSQYFSKLVGGAGTVVVFEPGTNNLPYLTRNTEGLKNLVIKRFAVSDHEGEASFYEDDMTGQNNSLHADYHGASGVEKSHGMAMTKQQVKVMLTTLDAFVSKTGIRPDFVKIDIEGHELAALKGAASMLSSLPALMVEVTENQVTVGDLLLSAGFILSDDSGRNLESLAGFSGNVFALRK